MEITHINPRHKTGIKYTSNLQIRTTIKKITTVYLYNSAILFFRFPDPGSVVLTIFYFPFGLILVIIRLFIALHALLVSCILPKSAATR